MAKLKEGDRVKIVKGYLHGKTGVIKEVNQDGLGEYYIVTTQDGYEGELPPGHVVATNDRACNAKFKVGDFVEELRTGRTWRVGRINGNLMEIRQWPGFGYTVAPMDGEFEKADPSVAKRYEEAQKNSRACNSQNPIVAKAMNACGTARNAKYNHEHTPEVMRFIKAALDYLKKASSYVAFAEEMSPVASAIHSVEEAIRKLQ